MAITADETIVSADVLPVDSTTTKKKKRKKKKSKKKPVATTTATDFIPQQELGATATISAVTAPTPLFIFSQAVKELIDAQEAGEDSKDALTRFWGHAYRSGEEDGRLKASREMERSGYQMGYDAAIAEFTASVHQLDQDCTVGRRAQVDVGISASMQEDTKADDVSGWGRENGYHDGSEEGQLEVGKGALEYFLDGCSAGRKDGAAEKDRWTVAGHVELGICRAGRKDLVDVAIAVLEEESDDPPEQALGYDAKDRGSSECHPDKEYKNLLNIGITSFTEIGQDESTIPVLKQRSYTGIEAISSALADTLCTDLGVEEVLRKLNTTLGTSYPLDSVIGTILESYISQNVDFGTAYAYLRRYWNNIHTIEHELRTREEKDREMRRNVLTDGRITRRDVPPRRVWDLRANRVVPYWVVCDRPWVISHAWVDAKDRVGVMTPINGCEWPVPIPKDTHLDLIRIEMLNTRSEWIRSPNAEYVWLDVLCLRQEGGKNEHLRFEEWKLDVPTIGRVYEEAASRLLCYFSGLGRPLHLPPDYFDDDRCWFLRAWTLQEITSIPNNGGKTGKDIVDKQVQKKFSQTLGSLRTMTSSTSKSILDLASEMQHRVSTKPLDKVAGLVYLLETRFIPIYDINQSPADAWEVLVDVMHPRFRAQLFFLYPAPGNGSKYWHPSWEQLMLNKVTAAFVYPHPFPVCRTDDAHADFYQGCLIESGNVRGLSEVTKELKPRRGEVVFNNGHGALHTLRIVAEHMYPIPDGFYTLLGRPDGISRPDRWVAGQIRQDGRFEKLSVFRSADGVACLHSLGLVHDTQVKTFLS
ncbi:hypothetical protein EDD18DRAFT_1460291 [Armillaria luteobubalina]|uniref:Heterokaryon incompatibility domain-containing protein n=1 Tax=Armillaria luteobubalina TaxID=153913 RepID=A0AA39UZE9_9AGAR|nr:hypothetical protein EDD18DRAFT_1460291 [Armillaria luteobubalina]